MISLSSQHTSTLNTKETFTQGYFVKNRNDIFSIVKSFWIHRTETSESWWRLLGCVFPSQSQSGMQCGKASFWGMQNSWTLPTQAEPWWALRHRGQEISLGLLQLRSRTKQSHLPSSASTLLHMWWAEQQDLGKEISSSPLSSGNRRNQETPQHRLVAIYFHHVQSQTGHSKTTLLPSGLSDTWASWPHLSGALGGSFHVPSPWGWVRPQNYWNKWQNPVTSEEVPQFYCEDEIEYTSN